MTSPTESPKSKTEKKILIETRRLAESVQDLNSFLALAAGQSWLNCSDH